MDACDATAEGLSSLQYANENLSLLLPVPLMIRATVQSDFTDEATLTDIVLKKSGLMVPLAHKFRMKPNRRKNPFASGDPTPVLGPSLRGGGHSKRENSLPLASSDHSGWIGMQIDVAMKIHPDH